jgi:hypothetical protein
MFFFLYTTLEKYCIKLAIICDRETCFVFIFLIHKTDFHNKVNYHINKIINSSVSINVIPEFHNIHSAAD